MEWTYYNHAMIPSTPPNITPDLTPLKDGTIWRLDKRRSLLARWTTDFDCGKETNWWYVIADKPFNLQSLKAKRRYEINKGLNNFEVHKINPIDYAEDIYEVQVAAFSAYPEKYRPTVDHDSFIENVLRWQEENVYGAFHKESGKLCGYSYITIKPSFINFDVLKTIPYYEKFGLNAALVYRLVDDYNELLSNGGFICDGERSINHETAFQDYLEKYFNFRKAYCTLNIAYNPKIKWLVKTLYLFRKVLLKLDNINIIHLVNALLKMEDIVRIQNKNNKETNDKKD